MLTSLAFMNLKLTLHPFADRTKVPRSTAACFLPSAVFPTTNEVDYLNLVVFSHDCLLPLAARHNRFVEFDGDSLRRQRQRIEQFLERESALRKFARLAVDLNAHDGFLSSGGM